MVRSAPLRGAFSNFTSRSGGSALARATTGYRVERLRRSWPALSSRQRAARAPTHSLHLYRIADLRDLLVQHEPGADAVADADAGHELAAQVAGDGGPEAAHVHARPAQEDPRLRAIAF